MLTPLPSVETYELLFFLFLFYISVNEINSAPTWCFKFKVVKIISTPFILQQEQEWIILVALKAAHNWFAGWKGTPLIIYIHCNSCSVLEGWVYKKKSNSNLHKI